MTSNSREALLLDRDYSLLGDEEHMAELVEYPGWEGALGFAMTQPLKAPETVYFVGNVEKIKGIDFPENNVRWPIMSTRMLRILKGVGDFEHQEIPIVFLDDRLPRAELLPRGPKSDETCELKGYSAVQLLTQSEAFDWETSNYDVSEYDPTLVKRLSFLRLKEPAGGYPPLFRLFAFPTRDFVSPDAARALQDAGIVGTSLEPVGDYPPRPR